MVYLFAKRVYRLSPLNPAANQLSKYGLTDERLALISAGLAAVYFYFILYAATLMTETFYISGLLWLLINALKLAQY